MYPDSEGSGKTSHMCRIVFNRPLVKSTYQKINFLISQTKHMLWVLKRSVSMRRFFRAPKTYVQTDGLEYIYNFTIKNCVYLNLRFKPSLM